ncbi:MAG: T9SS type A sorting domain-containing protein [Bacteroidetes bacterium]|nr:T9SS type A sorting domain-containing protein [Bacteroidota bacterium]MCW5896216.1 T9SS type A sorting domain-containing protein [Bacteroidota bacterium]
MKPAYIIFLLVFFIPSLHAQSWQYIGPDSLSWRSVRQMDVLFLPGQMPRIGVGTNRGVAGQLNGIWKYLPDRHLRPVSNDEFYRSMYFASWNDSLAFIGADVIELAFGEPGSGRGTLFNVYSQHWNVYIEGGGWVGHTPSLTIAISPHVAGKAYEWILYMNRTTSGGQEWETLSFESYGSFFLVTDQRRDSVLYAGSRPPAGMGIYRSTDDGSTWNLVRSMSFPWIYPHTYSDFYAHGDTLILSTSLFPNSADSSCGISISTDYGVSWNRVLSNTNVQKLIRDSVSPQHFYAAAQGGIYRSATSGLSWHLYAASLPSSKLVDIRKHPAADTFYVAFSDSGVYKVYDISTSLRSSGDVPLEFSLGQNYPNPFNPSTTIIFSLPHEAHVNLSLFDLLGRTQAVLVNGNREAGIHRINVDGSFLASGVYFYRMVSDAFVATRRMILLK